MQGVAIDRHLPKPGLHAPDLQSRQLASQPGQLSACAQLVPCELCMMLSGVVQACLDSSEAGTVQQGWRSEALRCQEAWASVQGTPVLVTAHGHTQSATAPVLAVPAVSCARTCSLSAAHVVPFIPVVGADMSLAK